MMGLTAVLIRRRRPRFFERMVAVFLVGFGVAITAEIAHAREGLVVDSFIGPQAPPTPTAPSTRQEASKTTESTASQEGQTRPQDDTKPQEKSELPIDRSEDAQLFVNPKYDDSALPVRREEERTPPTPIDWSIDGVLELSFDHLKFNIEADQAFEVRQLTLDLLKLRGRTIKIRGYIRPSFKEKGITRFVFVRDNQECCFGPGALLYDCMIVNMAPGHSIDFSTRPVSLEGRFELKPFRGPDKRVWAIFELNDTEIK